MFLTLAVCALRVSAAEIHVAAEEGNLQAIESLVKENAKVLESKDSQGNMPLHCAAMSKKVDAVELLLKLGADPNVVGHQGATPLHLAAESGSTDAVIALLKAGARDDVTDEQGRTPMQLAAHEMIRRRLSDTRLVVPGTEAFLAAASQGDLTLLESMLRQTPDLLKAADALGNTALMTAVLSKQPAAVGWLLDHKAPVNATSRSGFTALHHACEKADASAVELLLKAGADANGGTGAAPLPLALAMTLSRLPEDAGAPTEPPGAKKIDSGPSVQPEIVRLMEVLKRARTGRQIGEENRMVQEVVVQIQKMSARVVDVSQEEKETRLRIAGLLIDHKADPNKIGRTGEIAMIPAVSAHDPAGVKFLLEHGADPAAGSVKGMTMTALAVLCGRMEAMELLLAAGAKVAGTRDIPPLGIAAITGNEDLIRRLLDRTKPARAVLAADASLSTMMGKSLHPGAVRLLLDAGVNPDLPAPGTGRTALHQAAISSTSDVLQMLIEAGATLDKPDSAGFTPLHCAAEVNRGDNVEFLAARGANVSTPNHDGRTPLHSAAGEQFTDVMQLLVDLKADVNAVNKAGNTPLMAAAFMGRPNAVVVLLHNGADPERMLPRAQARALHSVARGNVIIASLKARPPAGYNGSTLPSAEDYARCAEHLLKAGADIEAPSGPDQAWTALGIAAEGGFLPVVEVLLRHGARTDNFAKDAQQRTPLHHAAFQGHADVIRALMKAGAKDQATALEGGQLAHALHFAAMKNHVEAAKALLEGGAPVDPTGCRWSHPPRVGGKRPRRRGGGTASQARSQPKHPRSARHVPAGDRPEEGFR